MEEEPEVDLLSVVEFGPLVFAVWSAVEETDRIFQVSFERLTTQHQSNVPDGRQFGRQAALRQRQSRRGLQPLETDRRLHLSEQQFELICELPRCIRIPQILRVAAQLGRYPKAEVPSLHLDDRADSAWFDRIDTGSIVAAK
ncbi:MAG: hypothetical protein P8Y94_10950, partial [Acidobacteriota bacterium]